MKLKEYLSFFVISFFMSTTISAQKLPIKCGTYIKSGWGKQLGSSQICKPYSWPDPGGFYGVDGSFTLFSIQNDFCTTLLERCSMSFPCSGPCHLTVLDSSSFTITNSFTSVCSWDGTILTTQNFVLLKLVQEDSCGAGEPAPGAPSLISVVNTIKGFSPAEQVLWSGSTDEKAPGIKICADGSRATTIYFNRNDPNVAISSIGFNVENSDGSNPDLYGKVTIDTIQGNTVVAVFQHPKYLPFSISAPFFESGIHIRYGDKEFRIPIHVYRAPIIMVHGLWSDRSIFQKMRSTLIEGHYYPSALIHTADYSNSNGESFATNSIVVPYNIKVALSICRLGGYSAGKVDVIGHSMGGILARNYLQSREYELRQDMNKLITINTPHSGSQICNLLRDTTSAFSKTAMFFAEPIIQVAMRSSIYSGAVNDLAVNSDAMKILNSQRINNGKVPSHTITTQSPWLASTFINLILTAVAPKFGITTGSLMNDLFYFQPNDLLVTVPSQTGGLFPATSTTPVFSQFHMGSTENDRVINEIKIALSTNTEDDSYFCWTGFNPVPQSSLYKKGQIYSPIQIIPGSLTIDYPLRNQKFSPGESIPVSLSSKNGIRRIILEAINLPDNSFVRDTNFSSGIINYTVPQNAFGKVKLMAIGYESDNLVGFDTLTVQINQISGLDSISIYGDAVYVNKDKSVPVTVTAYFKNGYHYNVSVLPDVNYQITDTAYAKYDRLNLVKGKNPGVTMLNVTYLDKSRYIPVFIFPTDTVSEDLTTSVGQIHNSGIGFSPEAFGDLKIFPNPFTSDVTIQYHLNQNTHVSIKIFELYGKQIAILENSNQEIGEHSTVFNETNLPSGMYLVQLKTENQTKTSKLILMK